MPFEPRPGRFTIKPTFTSRRRRLQTAICVLAFSLPKVATAQYDDHICKQFGQSAASFVGQVGAPARHWMIVGPDMPPQNIPVYPVVVEQAFRGVREGSTVYLYKPEVP